MTTARSLITRAFRAAKIYGAGEDPSSDDMTDALADLNDMLAAWSLIPSLNINHTTLALDDALTVPDAFLKGIRYTLAVELAPQYGADPAAIFIGGQTLAQLAESEKSAIMAAQRTSRVVSTDLSPCFMSVQNYGFRR